MSISDNEDSQNIVTFSSIKIFFPDKSNNTFNSLFDIAPEDSPPTGALQP